MTLVAALLVILIVVVVLFRGAEVKLTLLLAALMLGVLAGKPMVIVQTFLEWFTREQFLLPIGCCMGFAYVLRETQCDQHLVHLLLRPLRRLRPLLIPGVVLVGVLVNVPIISQSSTAVAVGSVLVPVLAAARISPTTVGAALALGASIGGELLNPGAPELRTISEKCQTSSIDCIHHIWPLLLVHLGVTVTVFWLLSLRYERQESVEAREQEVFPETFRVNLFKAFVPLIPLVLLFLTALPEPVRLFTIPREMLLPEGEKGGSFDSRLIGAAMLVGVIVAALSTPSKAGQSARVFFDGAGYALANITSLIVTAGCFGKGIELVGLAEPLRHTIKAAPQLLMPLASLAPLTFAWLSGSGMAATQSLFEFYVEPAHDVGADPLRVGAVVSLSAAAGRTMSPVAAVVLMSASLTGAAPGAMIRRLVVPLLAGLVAVVIVAMLTG
jgi:DcuC family C4-dicarboxylate transporter